MSIIQNLRDRAAWIISGAIAFALLIFVVEEGLRNKSVFGGSDSDLGKVNGTVINRIDFEERFKKIEDRYAQMGYPMDDAMRVQQKNSFWNETVEEAIMEKVYQDLGIEVTDKELGDLLFTIVNLARKLGVEPESALRKTNDKFIRRFSRMEQHLAATGRELRTTPLDALEEEMAVLKGRIDERKKLLQSLKAEVVDPATGETIAEVPRGGKEDVEVQFS